MLYVEILKIILPIFTALFIGAYCKKASIIDDESLSKIKRIIFDIILPIVMFNSFLFADFSNKSYVYVFAVYIGMISAYLLGNIIKKFYIKGYSDFLPETVSTWEGGTMGVALCSMLYGTFGIKQMAIFDFGCALFFYTIVAPILKMKDGKKVNLKELVKTLFSSRVFDFIIVGAMLGLLGVGDMINNNVLASTIYYGIVDITISPMTFLILFTVGYSININKKMLFPVISMCLMRIFCCTIALIIGYFFVFRFIPFDKKILVVLMTGYSLPPTYALPVFTNFKNKHELKELFSNVASFMVIFTLIFYIFISIYAI